jgi:hypothetical protein
MVRDARVSSLTAFVGGALLTMRIKRLVTQTKKPGVSRAFCIRL